MSAAVFAPCADRLDCARTAVCGISDLAPLIAHQLEGIAENGAAIEMVCRIEQLANLVLSAIGDDMESLESIEGRRRELYGARLRTEGNDPQGLGQ